MGGHGDGGGSAGGGGGGRAASGQGKDRPHSSGQTQNQKQTQTQNQRSVNKYEEAAEAADRAMHELLEKGAYVLDVFFRNSWLLSNRPETVAPKWPVFLWLLSVVMSTIDHPLGSLSLLTLNLNP
jgi:hypothetical protein